MTQTNDNRRRKLHWKKTFDKIPYDLDLETNVEDAFCTILSLPPTAAGQCKLRLYRFNGNALLVFLHKGAEVAYVNVAGEILLSSKTHQPVGIIDQKHADFIERLSIALREILL